MSGKGMNRPTGAGLGRPPAGRTYSGSLQAGVADTKAEQARKFLLRNLLVIVAALAFLVTYLVLGGINNSREDALASQQSEMLALQGQLTMSQDEVAQNQSEAIRVATDGMDTAHKADDDAVVTELMKQSLTWSGLAQYLKQRDQVMEEYGFASDSQFMQVFMPGEKEGVVRTAPSGKTYSAFEKDMQSTFSSLNSYVTAINGEVYSYFAVVELRVASGSGAASETAYVSMAYDMIDGQIANLDAYTTPGGMQRSG